MTNCQGWQQHLTQLLNNLGWRLPERRVCTRSFRFWIFFHVLERCLGLLLLSMSRRRLPSSLLPGRWLNSSPVSTLSTGGSSFLVQSNFWRCWQLFLCSGVCEEGETSAADILASLARALEGYIPMLAMLRWYQIMMFKSPVQNTYMLQHGHVGGRA